MAQRIKTVQESDLRMLGSLARSIQRVLPVTQADIDAAAALGKGWVVTRVFEVSDPLDNLRGGTQLVIRQNSVLPGQSVQRVLIVSGPGGETVVIGPGPSPLLLPDAIADSLSYVKAFGGTEQRNLPDNYIERQFIYMMEGSYLTTDITPQEDWKFEIEFKLNSFPSTGSSMTGTRPTNSAGAGIQLAVGTTGILTLDGLGTRYSTTNSVALNTMYKFVWDNKVATVYQGSTVFDTTTFTGTQEQIYPLIINALNNAGTASTPRTDIYLYSFKAWNAQGELVADYVPAVQKGTVPVVGFYDTVSGTFKTATAGTFAAGGEAVPTPDTPIDIVSNNGALKYGVLGKNLFDGQWQQGVYNTSTGTYTPNVNNRICNVNMIQIKPSTTYTVSCPDYALAGGMRWLFYDANKNFISATVSGVATITTPANAKYINFYIANNMTVASAPDLQLEQGSTATPYEPYRAGIYTDGTVETINAHGKNLFDGTVYNIAYVSNPNRVEYNASYRGIIIPVTAGNKYTISRQTVAGNRFNWYFTPTYPQDGDTAYNIGSTTATNLSATVTVPNGMSFLVVYFATNGSDILPSKIQVELGDTATEYAPYYDGGTATAEMLLKVGDYQDVQSIIDGVVTRKVGVKVFDGTEPWVSAGTGAAVDYLVALTKNQFASDIDTSATYNSFLCSHLKMGNNDAENTLSITVATFGVRLGLNTDITGTEGGATKLANAKQYLADQYNAGHPVIVIYPLATPTTESVAGQTLQVTDGDNVLEITQASLNNLELEAEYQASVSLTIQEVQDANLDPNVEVTIN